MPIQPQKALLGLKAYQPGRPISEIKRLYQLEDIIKLASNENPYGPAPSVLKQINIQSEVLLRYPDGNGFELKTALAKWHHCEVEQVTLGNGSNDVLELISRAFLSKEHAALFSEYAFAVYPLSALAVGSPLQIVPAQGFGHDLLQFSASINDLTTVIFIANPNNPTGTFISEQQLKKFLSTVPEDIVVVLDEAYTEYLSAEQAYNSVEWLAQFPNLIITRTFSKAYGLAGLRVGYALSSPQIADWLNRVRQPFNVNSLALTAACLALEDQDWINQTVAWHGEQKKNLERGLQKLGLSWIPSCANFITVNVEQGAELTQKLIEKRHYCARS